MAAVARAAIVVVLREAGEEYFTAQKALRRAEWACYHMRKCLQVEAQFFDDLWSLKNNFENLVHFHLRDGSPLETAPVAVLIGYIRSFQHHMPILARFAFRRWAGSLTVVLDALFLPITWDMCMKLIDQVVNSLNQQINTDDVRVLSTERQLAVCRRRFKGTRILTRSLLVLLGHL